MHENFIVINLQVLQLSMDKYLQGLFVLANDPAAEVRKLVRNSFNFLLKFVEMVWFSDLFQMFKTVLMLVLLDIALVFL